MIQHQDPEVQALLQMVQDSRDVAMVAAAQLTAENAKLRQDIADRDALIAAASAAQNAARTPSADVIELNPTAARQ